jgi:3-dehydroquinate synthase
MEQRVIISQNLKEAIAMAISECEHDHVFVLTDEHTEQQCWPVISDYFSLKHACKIVIPAGDNHKNINSLEHVWMELGQNGATRHSCLINLGGGMVTDLGGFAASTFKRGIDFINIPTTLLSMVDASVGGKTGINFNSLKNEIGVFNDSKFVILDTEFLKSLDTENLRSGYAEMLKHGLLNGNQMWAQLLNFNICHPDFTELQQMVADSVQIKEQIVKKDPHEKGLRKALNLGHTAGHAFESFSLRRKPILHGYAVAFGLIVELYLSVMKMHFPTDKMRQTVQFIRETYGSFNITCNDYDELLELMRHDKKNTNGIINFTLLKDVGKVKINQTASDEEIKEALDFFREG